MSTGGWGIIALAMLATTVVGVNPGLMLGISNPGLDYARQVAVPILLKDIKGVNLPDINGDVHTPVGSVDYSISSIQIEDVTLKSSSLVFTKTGVDLGLSGAAMSATAHWHYRENSFPHISDSGTVDISISFSGSATIDCIVDPATRSPQLTMSACSFDISSVDVHFHGGASWLYNIFKSLIEDAVKDALQTQLCPIVKNELGPANAALKKLPMNVSLTHGVVASYALTGNPIVTPDYLVTPHSGSFVPARVTAPCPFTAPVVPLLTTLPRMLYVWVTAYEPNTAGWAFQQAGTLDYLVTPADIPASSPVQLNTSTFSDIIPALSTKYPNMNMTVEVIARGAAPANVTVTPAALNVTLFFDLHFNVLTANKTSIPVFILNSTGNGAGNVTCNSSKSGEATLYFDIALLNAFVTVASSNIGPFDVSPLEALVEILIQGAVLPDINRAGADGVAIPMVDGVKLVNPQVVFASGHIRIDSDVVYTPTQ
eukprot:m.183803 g.183803  ORF g.183803 m.183803 type:complete len:485 (-) comp15001_c0_seq2:31-1485(-)